MSKQLSPYHAAREAIRLRAYRLYHRGCSLTHIAKTLGVTVSAVSQWMKTARAQGAAGLFAHPAPGARAQLTDAQLQHLLACLRQGAEAHGFHGDLWTAARVALLIHHTFEVTYSERHVRRLLRKLAWSPQQPIKREAKRNEAAIEAFRDVRYPMLKKSVLTKG